MPISNQSKVNDEATNLYYALFQLRQLNAKWHARNNQGRVPPLELVSRDAKRHQEVCRAYCIEMGQLYPADCR